MASDRLPHPKRYIVDNDTEGNSFFSTSLPDNLEVKSEFGGGLQRLGYVTERPPVSMSNRNDIKHYQASLNAQVPIIAPGGGANVWYNDLPPGAQGTMHRTVSFDIIIVVHGEFELILSNNDTRLIKAGDMVIQRCSLHNWRNTSKTEWARMVAIASECQPYITEKGEELVTYIPDA